MWYDSLVMENTSSQANRRLMSDFRSTQSWRQTLADAVTDPVELCRQLRLPASMAEKARRAADQYPMLVPRGFLSRIRPEDPSDPLLLQILPQEAEFHTDPRFVADPLDEADAIDESGLLSKYRNRSLIVTTTACAVHCRFCFRRSFRHPRQKRTISKALDRIAQDASIHELILSGGDPLMLDDDEIAEIFAHASQTPHLRRIRLHTRLPVLIPERITDRLLCILRGGSLTSIVVVHVNHPSEIDSNVSCAFGRLVDSGVMVLNQSVLLRDVNDRVDVLVELCERLIEVRVIPYYLHQLDRVAGTSHFEVPIAEGIRLIKQLRALLPGYAVPRYVQEIPGEPGKVVLA